MATKGGEADDLEVRTMHVFVSRALQKILRECPKKHAALRQSCIDVIGALPCLPEELRHASLPPTLFPHTPRLAEDLKKNGAESFPPPGDAEAGSPPSTPLPADVPSEREAPATQAEKDDAAGAAGLDDGDGADGTPMGDGELGSRMSACSMSDLGSPGAAAPPTRPRASSSRCASRASRSSRGSWRSPSTAREADRLRPSAARWSRRARRAAG